MKRLRWIIRAAIVAAIFVSFALGRVHATVRVAPGDPRVTIDCSAPEGDLASHLKAQGVTTQAQWVTYVNGLTATQMLNLVKARLVREVRLDPRRRRRTRWLRAPPELAA